MDYYIITSKKHNKMLVTQDYTACFDFITSNIDVRIKTMDISAKPKTIDKRTFLKTYLKNTKDQNKFFILAEILVKGKNNLSDLFNAMGLMAKYRKFKEINEKIL